MTKFICLQEANGTMRRLLLNAAFIAAIQSGNQKDVYVRMCYNTITNKGEVKTEYFFVSESFEEIVAMLSDKTPEHKFDITKLAT